MPKLHWTQRPENKAKLQRMTKRAAKVRKAMRLARLHATASPEPTTAGPLTTEPSPHHAQAPLPDVTYLYGKIEATILQHAQRTSVPYEVLARGVAELLGGTHGGRTCRTSH